LSVVPRLKDIVGDVDEELLESLHVLQEVVGFGHGAYAGEGDENRRGESFQVVHDEVDVEGLDEAVAAEEA
jgi:hypothetical protein